MHPNGVAAKATMAVVCAFAALFWGGQDYIDVYHQDGTVIPSSSLPNTHSNYEPKASPSSSPYVDVNKQFPSVDYLKDLLGKVEKKGEIPLDDLKKEGEKVKENLEGDKKEILKEKKKEEGKGEQLAEKKVEEKEKKIVHKYSNDGKVQRGPYPTAPPVASKDSPQKTDQNSQQKEEKKEEEKKSTIPSDSSHKMENKDQSPPPIPSNSNREENFNKKQVIAKKPTSRGPSLPQNLEEYVKRIEGFYNDDLIFWIRLATETVLGIFITFFLGKCMSGGLQQKYDKLVITQKEMTTKLEESELELKDSREKLEKSLEVKNNEGKEFEKLRKRFETSQNQISEQVFLLEQQKNEISIKENEMKLIKEESEKLKREKQNSLNELEKKMKTEKENFTKELGSMKKDFEKQIKEKETSLLSTIDEKESMIKELKQKSESIVEDSEMVQQISLLLTEANESLSQNKSENQLMKKQLEEKEKELREKNEKIKENESIPLDSQKASIDAILRKKEKEIEESNRKLEETKEELNQLKNTFTTSQNTVVDRFSVEEKSTQTQWEENVVEKGENSSQTRGILKKNVQFPSDLENFADPLVISDEDEVVWEKAPGQTEDEEGEEEDQVDTNRFGNKSKPVKKQDDDGKDYGELYKQAQNEIQSQSDRIEGLCEIIDGNENELNELREKLEELESSKEEFETRIESLSQELMNNQEEEAKRRDSDQQNLILLESRLERASKGESELKGTNEDLLVKIKSKSEENDALKKEIEALKNNLDRNLQSGQSNNENLEKIQSELNQSINKSNELQGMLDALSSEKEELNLQLVKLNDKNEDLKTKKEESKEEIQSLKEEIQKINEILHNSQQERDQYLIEKSQSFENAERLNQEKGKLEKENEKISAEINQLSEENESLSQKLAEMEQQVSRQRIMLRSSSFFQEEAPVPQVLESQREIKRLTVEAEENLKKMQSIQEDNRVLNERVKNLEKELESREVEDNEDQYRIHSEPTTPRNAGTSMIPKLKLGKIDTTPLSSSNNTKITPSKPDSKDSSTNSSPDKNGAEKVEEEALVKSKIPKRLVPSNSAPNSVSSTLNETAESNSSSKQSDEEKNKNNGSKIPKFSLRDSLPNKTRSDSVLSNTEVADSIESNGNAEEAEKTTPRSRIPRLSVSISKDQIENEPKQTDDNARGRAKSHSVSILSPDTIAQLKKEVAESKDDSSVSPRARNRPMSLNGKLSPISLTHSFDFPSETQSEKTSPDLTPSNRLSREEKKSRRNSTNAYSSRSIRSSSPSPDGDRHEDEKHEFLHRGHSPSRHHKHGTHGHGGCSIEGCKGSLLDPNIKRPNRGKSKLVSEPITVAYAPSSPNIVAPVLKLQDKK
eukprot:TRINITY_DN2131_c0_g2_i1.p1 TRINITY_DN2131_c0_g2~~TRINITY_DN2131_c0_g2_i1.p1  ORF type:complete len:1361 (+),score=619.74 TRINITY_DN2131_c0_g2_i1:130-4212(+)